MSDTNTTFTGSVDYAALLRDHPIGDDFVRMATTISADELRAHQERLFKKLVARAGATAFYKRLWGANGIEPGDVKSLEDLPRLPTFGKQEIVESIALAPPFGDFAGLDSYPQGQRPPMIFHTTSGTTGKPQPLFFGAKTREVQNLLLARLFRWQGMTPDDVVHSVYGHGMINGGHYIREAVTRFTSATFMSAGTGIETRSAAQVALMRDFGATVILGFTDYIKKLAEVARAEGLIPGEDINIRMISGQFGREDKQAVSDLWGGAVCYDWYGVGDTGMIAGEGPDRDGHYVMEDAHWVEVCDIDTGAPVADGQTGDLVVTCLFKDDVYPIIRFNTHDVTAIRTDPSKIGVKFKRIEGFLGRSDNMVKLRGINVFPQAIGPMLAEIESFAGEWICKVMRDDAGRDELTVVCEDRGGAPVSAYQETLKRKLGIEAHIELVGPGGTAALTQIEARQKPIRLLDGRS
jgi:phenylacetate-CoA ligase